jgi:hypothetical protein
MVRQFVAVVTCGISRAAHIVVETGENHEGIALAAVGTKGRRSS